MTWMGEEEQDQILENARTSSRQLVDHLSKLITADKSVYTPTFQNSITRALVQALEIRRILES